MYVRYAALLRRARSAPLVGAVGERLVLSKNAEHTDTSTRVGRSVPVPLGGAPPAGPPSRARRRPPGLLLRHVLPIQLEPQPALGHLGAAPAQPRPALHHKRRPVHLAPHPTVAAGALLAAHARPSGVECPYGTVRCMRLRQSPCTNFCNAGADLSAATAYKHAAAVRSSCAAAAGGRPRRGSHSLDPARAAVLVDRLRQGHALRRLRGGEGRAQGRETERLRVSPPARGCLPLEGCGLSIRPQSLSGSPAHTMAPLTHHITPASQALASRRARTRPRRSRERSPRHDSWEALRKGILRVPSSAGMRCPPSWPTAGR